MIVRRKKQAFTVFTEEDIGTTWIKTCHDVVSLQERLMLFSCLPGVVSFHFWQALQFIIYLVNLPSGYHLFLLQDLIIRTVSLFLSLIRVDAIPDTYKQSHM